MYFSRLDSISRPFKTARLCVVYHRVQYTLLARCNPPGIKIDIMAKRCVICHLKAWTLLIIVLI